MSVNTAAMNPDTGVRAPALSLTSDCDIPPLTGNPRPSPAADVGDANRQQLLVGVEPVAVLLAEHPANRGGLDSGEHEARERNRQEVVQLLPAHVGQPQRRQALRHVAEQRDALRLEIERPRREHARDHHEEGDRPMLQPQFAGHQRQERGDADRQRRLVRVAQVRDEVRRTFPEVSMRTLEPEQLRQLGARQVERQAGLEADENGFGKEADRVAGANQPGGEGNRRHHERDAGRERRVAGRIARAQLTHRGPDQER